LSDRYLNFVNSQFGSTVASRVGLPQPAKLRRYSAGDPLLPGPALLGAILDQDIVDPFAAPARSLVARAGARVDQELAEAIGALRWLNVGELLVGGVLGKDIANPADRRVYAAGTAVDAGLAGAIEDLARIVGADILIGLTLGKDLAIPAGTVIDARPAETDENYPAGTVVDVRLAETIDRLAWVKIRSWRPRADGQLDAGQALIRLLGRFAAVVVDRINRAPEKYELAFLNLIGTRPLPPLPARVPLTFSLVERSPGDAMVPAGSRVAATPLDGEQDEVVFETETDLVVIRAGLRAVVVGDAENDRYSDRTGQPTGPDPAPFPVFVGDQPVPHQLFIA